MHNETLYVTAVDIWDDEQVHVFASCDLENWESWFTFELPGYGIFNTSLTWAESQFVLMFEIGKPENEAGERFTAPHCLHYLDGYYFDFYLEAHDGYEMRGLCVQKT